MKQEYVSKRFNPLSLHLIYEVNAIVEDYQAQGFRLTTRQIYYQLVARAAVPNTLESYKRVASIINDGKLAGMIDWEAIEDRTREFTRQTRWDNGAHILRACIDGYHQDLWVGQEFRVFVIVEKEALVGVLEPTCRQYDVPLLAARGYPSGTVLREFVESDISPALSDEKRIIILHLGDHDPSGLDMSRDLDERLRLFAGLEADNDYDLALERIALNMDQVREVNPPENPAKSTDARFASYQKRFGVSSWELDALSPTYLAGLLEGQIKQYISRAAWAVEVAKVDHVRSTLIEVAKELK